MEILLIKDSKGKDILVFRKEDINEYEEMGNKVDDFEILQVLGKGSFGFVAKVKSRLNHKIYAMKQIDFSTIEDKRIIDLCINETKLLKELNHSLIIKYYKSIKEENLLYIIMEFMDNGDLGGMLKANKMLEKPIKEEKIYDIFIQSMKSLSYIHSKKLAHRDIKPDNLFISVDGCVKLGDFGVSATIIDKSEKNKNLKYLNDYNKNNIKDSIIGDVICKQTVIGTPPFMSPEMINETIYDLKTDVYSMGVTFFEICFWHLPRVPALSIDGGIKLVDVPIRNNKDEYSKELIDIIYKMIERDKNQRPDSDTVLNLLIHEFNKKYARNSSIGSVLSCLYACQDFTEYLSKPKTTEKINENKSNKPISFAFLYGINSICNNVDEDWNISLCKIRNVLVNENNRYSGNKEIEIRHILFFLLGKMHKELNNRNKNFQTKTSEIIEYHNKSEALQNFILSSQQNNKSAIFDYFYGCMKTKTICGNCKQLNNYNENNIAFYSFNNYYFVSFNIDLAEKYNNSLNLEGLFQLQNNICITIDATKQKYCRQCNSVQTHYQRKQFYTLPHFLIICLDRGYNCNNKKKILYNLELNLQNQSEVNVSPKQYKLVGIVKRLDKSDKEHYISLYFDYKLHSWFLRDDCSLTKINDPMNHNQGIEICFFYKDIDINNNSNYRKSDSSKSIEKF